MPPTLPVVHCEFVLLCECVVINVFLLLTAQLHHYICNVNPHLPPLFLNVCSKQYKQFQR